jgi:Fe-S oxidoreductase
VAEVDTALRQSLNIKGERAGRAETALFAGASAASEAATLQAARALLESAGVEHSLVAPGRDSGYLAYTLGLHETARDLARATAEELTRLGCRKLVVLAPEHAHVFTHVYPLLGVPLPEQLEVVELTVLLAALLDQGRLRLSATALDLAYHDPCQTPRIDERWRAPRRLLAALTTQEPREGFWRERRAASCGASGGLPWTQPKLAGQMARAALADATRNGTRLVVTDAPGCLAHLRANADATVEVRGLYELLAEGLEA